MKINKKAFIRTYTSKKFFPFAPTREMVTAMDIAHALSQKVRWQGHCNRFYSVAEHSLRVADVCRVLATDYPKVSPDIAELYGLLHDAGEAYIPDIPTPIKNCVPEWRKIEDGIVSAVFDHFSLPKMTRSYKTIVKAADEILLRVEAEELFDTLSEDIWPNITSINVPESCKEALNKTYTNPKTNFMEQLNALTVAVS